MQYEDPEAKLGQLVRHSKVIHLPNMPICSQTEACLLMQYVNFSSLTKLTNLEWIMDKALTNFTICKIVTKTHSHGFVYLYRMKT